MEEAEREFRLANDLGPHELLPRLLLGQMYVAKGRWGEAEALYAGLKAVAPNDPSAYQALGIFYLSTGQKEKAVAEFRARAAQKPQDNSIKEYLVETLLALNRLNEAAVLNQQVLDAAPGDPRALLAAGRLKIAQGRYGDAQTLLENAVRANPQSADAYYFLGIVQKALGLVDLAKASLSRAKALQPRMGEAAAALASLNDRSNPAEALRQADEALKANPNLTSAYLTRGRILFANGEAEQGAAAIREVLKRDPVSLPALAAWLNESIQQKKTEEITQRLSGLVQQYPRNPGLHLLFAVACFENKALDKAEASVRQALAIDPKTPDAYSMLANIEFAKGATENAKAHLRSAIAASPQKLSNYMALVKQYEKEGNWGEAKALCEKAHQVDPEAPYVSAELAFLYLEHGGDVNLAVSLAQTVRQKMPDSPVAADLLGWSYYKLGSIDSAIAHLKESTRKEPDNPMYQYHLGMAYMAARQFDLASGTLRRALRTDPNFLDAANTRAALNTLTKRLN